MCETNRLGDVNVGQKLFLANGDEVIVILIWKDVILVRRSIPLLGYLSTMFYITKHGGVPDRPELGQIVFEQKKRDHVSYDPVPPPPPKEWVKRVALQVSTVPVFLPDPLSKNPQYPEYFLYTYRIPPYVRNISILTYEEQE